MLADGFEFNEITYGTLINGLCDAGKTKVAVRLLRMIQHCVFNVKPNVVMYSRIIEALCKEGLVNEACEWYYEMVGNNVEPTVFTFRPLVRALCVAGWLNEAVWMVEEMISKGIYVDLYVFSVLIDGLCKKGMVGEAREVFDEMIKRGCGVSVVACSSLMVGYCLKNEVDEARRLFDAVVGRPDVWSYNVLINGYCKVRRLDDAMKLFYEMWGKNVVPNLVTYNLLVDCVCDYTSDLLRGFLFLWRLSLTPLLMVSLFTSFFRFSSIFFMVPMQLLLVSSVTCSCLVVVWPLNKLD